MFRPYMWAIFRLSFNLQISCTSCVGRLGGWGKRDLVVSVVGAVTPGCYKWIFSSCLCTHVKWFCHSYAKSMLLNQHNGDDAPQDFVVLFSM